MKITVSWPELVIVLWVVVVLLLVVVVNRKAKNPRRWVKWIVAVSLLLLAGGGWYHHAAQAEKKLQRRVDHAQQRLATIPVYRLLKQQEPLLYRQLQEALSAGIRKGIPEKEAIGRLRMMLSGLLNQRIGLADDREVIRYIALSLQEMEWLRAKDAQLCFRFLFPQINGGVNLAMVLPPALQQEDLAVIAQLLQNSKSTQQKVDLPAARRDLLNVVNGLRGQWGDDLRLLNMPADTHINRGKMCDMTTELYRGIMALPPTRATNVLRMILAADAG